MSALDLDTWNLLPSVIPHASGNIKSVVPLALFKVELILWMELATGTFSDEYTFLQKY